MLRRGHVVVQWAQRSPGQTLICGACEKDRVGVGFSPCLGEPVGEKTTVVRLDQSWNIGPIGKEVAAFSNRRGHEPITINQAGEPQPMARAFGLGLAYFQPRSCQSAVYDGQVRSQGTRPGGRIDRPPLQIDFCQGSRGVFKLWGRATIRRTCCKADHPRQHAAGKQPAR